MRGKTRLIVNDEKETEYTEYPTFPRNIMVELTNICNHNCIMCGYKDMSRKKRNCDKEFTFKIIQDAYDCGAREIGLYLIGEPFLNTQIDEFVYESNRIGYDYIYLTTNGALASPDRLKSIINAGLDSIKFSVNAASAPTYFNVHGKDDFDVVRNNIVWLRDYIDSNGFSLKTFVSFVLVNANKEEENSIHQLFDDYVDSVSVFPCGFEGGGTATKLVSEGIVDHLEIRKSPCSMLFNRIHITVEGYLDACCADTDGYLVYSDLHNEYIGEAWHNDTIVKLRREHLNKLVSPTLCYNCINQCNRQLLSLLDI